MEVLLENSELITSIIHPEDFSRLSEEYEHAIREIRASGLDLNAAFVKSLEIRIKQGDGGWTLVEANFNVLSFTPEGSMAKVFCTLKDITFRNSGCNEIKTQGWDRKRKSDKSNDIFVHGQSKRHNSQRDWERNASNHLGAREKEVLQLIAQGYSDKQIGHHLGISTHTSIRHRKNLIGKFEVKNTAELIKDASKHFWL